MLRYILPVLALACSSSGLEPGLTDADANGGAEVFRLTYDPVDLAAQRDFTRMLQIPAGSTSFQVTVSVGSGQPTVELRYDGDVIPLTLDTPHTIAFPVVSHASLEIRSGDEAVEDIVVVTEQDGAGDDEPLLLVDRNVTDVETCIGVRAPSTGLGSLVFRGTGVDSLTGFGFDCTDDGWEHTCINERPWSLGDDTVCATGEGGRVQGHYVQDEILVEAIGDTDRTYHFVVPEDAVKLRVQAAFTEVALQRGQAVICSGDDYCEVPDPVPGAWSVTVDREDWRSTVTVGAILPVDIVAPDDHGDSMLDATPFDTMDVGHLSAGDHDFFSLAMPNGGTLQTVGDTDTLGVLYDTSGASVTLDDDSGDGLNFLVDVPPDFDGSLLVRGFSSVTSGGYTLVGTSMVYAPGETCGEGFTADCSGSCERDTWLGDGMCDDVYACEELMFDLGDCEDPDAVSE